MKKNSFAEGLRLINTKGALVKPGVRLTKARAQIILSFVHKYRHEWNDTHEESDADNDMQSAMQWILNKIYKRWSQNEIYSE